MKATDLTHDQSVDDIKKVMQSYANPQKAATLSRFFKTNKGEYGEGDLFIGIVVPDQRRIATQFRTLPLDQVCTLLKSPVHEHKLTALIIMTMQYKKADPKMKQKLFDAYTAHYKYVNNWDLVDLSAPYILGPFLLDHPDKKDILYDFARSNNLWKKRISIISTYAFIRANQYEDTLTISKILLNDKHDLIHKATGWMLREVGKKDINVEMTFLDKHYKTMPRTMLRYAIERFDPDLRNHYMGKK